MTNKEIIQISKSKPKKISILCTFKSTLLMLQISKSYIYNTSYKDGMRLTMRLIHASRKVFLYILDEYFFLEYHTYALLINVNNFMEAHTL
jgi:hypothetical protein